MKKIIYTLLLLFAFSASAKEIIVNAYGEGDDYDWAVMNAVENAVRQTSDIAVQSTGLHKVDLSTKLTHNANFEGETKDVKSKASENVRMSGNIRDNSKDIIAQYNGVVSSYEVIKHTEENGKHKVEIKAVVVKEETYDAHDYKSKSLVKKADYSLAIMPFKVASNANCLGRKPDIKSINSIISNLFVEKLAPSHKFNLVDRNNLDDYDAEMSLIEDDMTLPENKVKLQNLVTADYILVGTVDNLAASTSQTFIPLTGETSYSSSSKLKLSYRILETATMEIVSADSVEKTFSKDGAFSSCANVEQLLFERAIGEAAEKLLTDIFPDYKSASKVEEKKPVIQASPTLAPDYSLPMY